MACGAGAAMLTHAAAAVPSPLLVELWSPKVAVEGQPSKDLSEPASLFAMARIGGGRHQLYG